MAVRELRPEERPKPKPVVAVIVRPRALRLEATQTPDSPLVGSTIELQVAVTNLESIERPVHHGRALADAELYVTVIDPRGMSCWVELEHLSLGQYKAALVPRLPGLHGWNVGVTGLADVTVFLSFFVRAET